MSSPPEQKVVHPPPPPPVREEPEENPILIFITALLDFVINLILLVLGIFILSVTDPTQTCEYNSFNLFYWLIIRVSIHLPLDFILTFQKYCDHTWLFRTILNKNNRNLIYVSEIVWLVMGLHWYVKTKDLSPDLCSPILSKGVLAINLIELILFFLIISILPILLCAACCCPNLARIARIGHNNPLAEGLTEEQINTAIQTINFIPPSLPENNNTSTNTCSVCLVDFQKEEQVSQLNCSHLFHSTCIRPWLLRTKSCPNCRNTNLLEPAPLIPLPIIHEQEEQKQAELQEIVIEQNPLSSPSVTTL